MNERSWVLTGSHEIELGLWQFVKRREVWGTPISVEADWSWALAREESVGDVVGFLHTHPCGLGTTPSWRDTRTMRAWCTSFGKPLLCLIGEGSDLTGYVFTSGFDEGEQVKQVEQNGVNRYRIRN